MGKYVLYIAIASIVVVIGMLLYPTQHYVISLIDVTAFTDLEKAGMVLISYGLLFFIGYIAWKHVR